MKKGNMRQLIDEIWRTHVNAGSPSNFKDVRSFHTKFGIGRQSPYPHLFEKDVWDFRLIFLRQELTEIEDAYAANDLVGFFDGLIDLVFVALGTADLAALPWQSGWNIVQWANMQKQRVANAEESRIVTGRGHHLDVIKPPGWISPDLLLKELLDGLYHA